jgi:hypothetical protein
MNQLFKTLGNETKPIRLSQEEGDLGIKHFRCSSYIKSKNILIKGEYNNQDSAIRKAIIILSDPTTGQVKGIP